MPVALIEAAALGMPIVSTNVGGIPDMLEHGRTGLLVRSKDEIAMCEAIDKLLTDPSLTARLSENARALAEQCSWGSVKNEWEMIFSQILIERASIDVRHCGNCCTGSQVTRILEVANGNSSSRGCSSDRRSRGHAARQRQEYRETIATVFKVKRSLAD